MPTRQLTMAQQACEHSGNRAWQSLRTPVMAEGRPPVQDPVHLPVGRPWCAGEVVVHAMHAVEIGQSGHKVGGRCHRLAVAMCRVQAIVVAACWCSVTKSFLAELPSDGRNKYSYLKATLMMVLDVIVSSTRCTSLTRTPPQASCALAK